MAGGLIEPPVNGADEIRHDVGMQRPEGAEGAGRAWHQHAPDVDFLRKETGDDGAGPAKGDQGEVARIDAAPLEHRGELGIHGRQRDPYDGTRRFGDPKPETTREPGHGPF